MHKKTPKNKSRSIAARMPHARDDEAAPKSSGIQQTLASPASVPSGCTTLHKHGLAVSSDPHSPELSISIGEVLEARREW